MNSPCLKEVAQIWLQGCCRNPILGGHEAEQNVDKRRSTTSACRHDFATKTTTSFFPNTQFTNHESLPSFYESFSQFIKAYPKYAETARVDKLRDKEYDHLSLSSHVCLDYIGVGLFSHSQVPSKTSIVPVESPSYPHFDVPLFDVTYKCVDLKTQLLHGGEGSNLESAIRKRIVNFLNISMNDYCMVFTANRSSAFKLVAESYPFQTSRKLLTVYDHKSEALEAMISTSEKRGARVMSADFNWPRLRIHSAKLKTTIVKEKKKKESKGLFVFPLQSRVSGASYSYQWMKMAEENGWHVLLDACALGPKDMDSFGLSLFHPDFLICSFYKVFGENPTGFGCLFVKKTIIPILEASTGAGIVSLIPAKQLYHFPEDSSGTDTELEQTSQLFTNKNGLEITSTYPIPMTAQPSQKGSSTSSNVHKMEVNVKDNQQECAEKATVSTGEVNIPISENGSLNIECRCLDQVDSLGLRLINSRGRYLINWLISALMKLQHPNRLENALLVRIYGPKIKFDRGPALAFNIYDWKGERVEPVLVQKLADRNNISLSHGFLQHVWFSDKYEEEKQRVLKHGEKETVRNKGRKTDQGIAVVSIALTFLANFEDIYKLWTFIAQFLDADFVEKERWRYTALSQKTIEV